MEIILIALLVVLVVALMAWISHLRSRVGHAQGSVQLLESQLGSLRTERDALQMAVVDKDSRITQLQQELTACKVENSKLAERMDFVGRQQLEMQKKSELQFRTLAQEIISCETQKFRDHSETRIAEILRPLRDNISEFRKTVADNFTAESKDRAVLNEHLRRLMELNATIGKEAKDLSDALRGNTKIQGDWGEMILESVLEKSGLMRDENYFVQVARNDNGERLVDEKGNNLRPDVVVCLPDKKYIVIDSKVSLTAYTRYVNADTDAERDRHGREHVASVRMHFKELESKRYQDYVGVSAQSRIDFVLMFIPNEHAYIAAMALDRNLWMEAYEKRIVIISPAHVISTLRLIAQLWSRDKQTKNALQIAEESGKLYDKFVGFVDDLRDIANCLDRTKASYDSAMKKLASGRGNLISRVETLKQLGAKATKSLPVGNDEA